MVFQAGGSFSMGTDATDRALTPANPAHVVEVDAFCIDRTEVSLGAYRECSDQGECKRAFRDAWWPQGGSETEAWDKSRLEHSTLCNENYDERLEHPVNCVTWAQAKSYCRFRGARLPSEAQWEFAARGSESRAFPWGSAAPASEHLNAAGTEFDAWQGQVGLEQTGSLYELDDGFVGTAPVGSFAAGATPESLVDMAGNVFEWTADGFEPYPGGSMEPQPDRRVIRGGAFNSVHPQFADPALRFAQSPNAHSDGIGFRCVTRPRG
jgi:formylglycine-generating enzyme required for sulfatase activity